MDWLLIDQKLESLRRALKRVVERCPDDIELLLRDIDAQDIVTLNLTRAVQLCVDIGAHLVAATDSPPPVTMGGIFDVLSSSGIINTDVAERMKKAVGFRNVAVHDYQEINWHIVFAIVQSHITDFEDFAKDVLAWRERESG